METQAGLTVDDMIAAVAVIELAMARGAIKAAEAKSVGQLYDRLSAFVASVKQSMDEKSKAANDSDIGHETMAE